MSALRRQLARVLRMKPALEACARSTHAGAQALQHRYALPHEVVASTLFPIGQYPVPWPVLCSLDLAKPGPRVRCVCMRSAWHSYIALALEVPDPVGAGRLMVFLSPSWVSTQGTNHLVHCRSDALDMELARPSAAVSDALRKCVAAGWSDQIAKRVRTTEYVTSQAVRAKGPRAVKYQVRHQLLFSTRGLIQPCTVLLR